MAEGSVTFLLMKLSEILTDESNLLFGVKGDAKYIKDELEFSLAFLRVAESSDEEEIDPLFKVWVKNLRDVAYEMEDVLADFMLHLAHDHGHGVCNCLNKTSDFIISLKARHQIAATMRDIRTRIKEIKTRVEDISKARTSFNHIISKWRGVNYSGGVDLAAQQDPLLLEEANLVGIEMPKGKLIGWLLGSKSQLEVVSVVGAGVDNKTTLVKRVYENSQVKKHFKFCAWIILTQYFKTRDLLQEIVRQLYHVLREPSPEGFDTMSDHELRVGIKKFLQQRRYLIVLDDVWSNDAWNVFKHAFPKNTEGSRILLTTRISEVAKNASIESPNRIFALDSLSSKDAWTLFCKKTFQSNSCPPHLENVSQQILGRCEGLPLAIIAISGVLATRDNTRIDEWDMVYRSLGAEIQANHNLGNMKKVLSLSYYNLPYYLKCCLLYFSIFPEGHPIEHRRLVRLWVAEGFVVETEGRMLEEVAESYLNELIERSLVQVVEAASDGRVKKCRIQGILHEIIISKAKDQGFAAITKEESMILPERVRRLSIQNVRARIQRISRFTSASGLRSLLVFSELDILPESPLFDLSLSDLRMLNVLELGGTHLQEFPNEVTNLLLLKYLSLRNTDVNYIPNSIGNLQYLETLDLKNSRVTELPTAILKLQKLRQILVYRYETKFDDQMETKQTIGFKLQTHIRGLRSLQKLCFLEANPNSMKEIGELTQLRRLGIVNLRKEDGVHLCPSIAKLTNLRALSVASTIASESLDLGYISSPPKFLQRLYLKGRLERLPDWISSLESLEKVVLKWSKQSGDPLVSLQHLPNLVHVEFVQVYDGELLNFQAEGFPKLKFLVLNKLDRLKEIVIEKGAMPCLQKLIVQNCGLLQRVPSGIEHLTRLRVLEFTNVPVNLILTLHPDRNDGDYLKIARVPEVYFHTYWNNGKWDVFSLEIFRKDEPYSHQSSQLWTGDHPVEVSSPQETISTQPVTTTPVASTPASMISASNGVEDIDPGSSAIPPSLIPTTTEPSTSNSQPSASIFRESEATTSLSKVVNEDEAIDAIIARILNVGEPRVGAWKLASSTSPSSPLQAMNIITSGLKQGITLMDNPSDLAGVQEAISSLIQASASISLSADETSALQLTLLHLNRQSERKSLIDTKSRELEQIEQQISQGEEKTKASASRIKECRNVRDSLNAQIADFENELARARGELEVVLSKLGGLHHDLKQQDATVSKNREIKKKLNVEIQQLQRMILSDNSTQSLLPILDSLKFKLA